VATLAQLVRQHLPELGEADAMQVCAQAVLVIGATWTHARPSPSMLAAYASDASLAELRMDFASALQATLATLVAGTLAQQTS
jgi:hypothetical protein